MRWLKRNKVNNEWDATLVRWMQNQNDKLPMEVLNRTTEVATGALDHAFEQLGVEPDDAISLGRALLVLFHRETSSDEVPEGFSSPTPEDVMASIRARYGEAVLGEIVAFVDGFGRYLGAGLRPLREILGSAERLSSASIPWPQGRSFAGEAASVADEVVLREPTPSASQVAADLSDAAKDLGSFYIGAHELGEQEMEASFEKLLTGVRIGWHFAAKIEGRTAPTAQPQDLPPEEALLLAKLAKVDRMFPGDLQPSTELALQVLDQVSEDLVQLAREASPSLRQGDFRVAGLQKIQRPSLKDYLALQLLRVRRARRLIINVGEILGR
jgi:hypothetical protein